MQKIFRLSCAVIGLAQLGLNGCGPSVASVAKASPLTASQPASIPEQPGIPVRISRGLFDQTTLHGSVSFNGSLNTTSSVSWNEQAAQLNPVAPDPNGGTPIAVFDDHVGCAAFASLSPLKICFNIQSDVSSLTLNSDQMHITGIEAITDSSCISDVKFVSATKDSNQGFVVTYLLKEVDDSRCAGKGGTLQLSVHAL